MANNSWVTSKKTIKLETVNTALADLNDRLFKGNLKIVYEKSTPDKPSWGKHTWLLQYSSGGKEYAKRICWLETSKKFVLRHGSGSKFTWWLASAVLNEIAVVTGGTLYDEGIDGKLDVAEGKYDKFSKYVKAEMAHIDKRTNAGLYRHILETEREFAPPEFLDQLVG